MNNIFYWMCALFCILYLSLCCFIFAQKVFVKMPQWCLIYVLSKCIVVQCLVYLAICANFKAWMRNASTHCGKSICNECSMFSGLVNEIVILP